MRITTVYMLIFFTALVLSAMETLAEDEIYRWVDENGVVHFGNRAPQQADAELVPIQQHPGGDTSSSSNAVSADTDQQPEEPVSYAQQQRDERAKKRKEAAERNKAIAESCAQARRIVAQLEPMTRVMTESEDGTVIRMDDNDRLKLLGEAKTFIAGNCDE